ncbi:MULTISPECIES: organic hydroperoxide resistance protein [Marinomonas]|jgi:Ohr subfamily peroxiredoxin|uniref:organic hydroperoxide resistance protein n=1 Tax=Marinomonas TaxID=28253 RepID=UPI00105636A0|nr:organic hydroperoxide resistance protein [Marinomonas sp. KMM3893]
MTALNDVLYTARAKSTGGRTGESHSDDGALQVTLSTPKALGGAGGNGTNPEQLFAAGYSACFIGALQLVASQQKVTLPADTNIDASVSIGPIEHGFGIAADLVINVPGLDKAVAEKLVDDAHQVCPYSNATRNNIEVTLSVNV